MTKTFPSMASVGTTQCTDIVIDNEIYEESPKQLTVSLSSSHSRVTASGTVMLNIIDNDSSYIQHDHIIYIILKMSIC